MVIAVRAFAPELARGQAVADPAPAPVDFRAILGEAQWARLPAAVQARFCLAAGYHPHSYSGRMIVRANLAGALIAQICRAIGTPLAPWRGDGVGVSVHVHPDRKGGLVWDRTYSFANRRPITVSSTKLIDRDGALMEVIRCGIGMRLTLSVRAGALHFRSIGYFIPVLGLRVPVPTWLTPGRALITHQDAGGGWFRFTLSFRHPVFGETLFQTGLFRET